MSKETAYHLQLKGFVGGADFDRKAVNAILEKNQGKQDNGLFDLTGDVMNTGRFTTSAFIIYNGSGIVIDLILQR